MNKLAVLILALAAGAWFAQPVLSGGRAGALYEFRKPPAFEDAAAAATWLDAQGANGFVLKTDVVLMEDGEGKLHLIPADSIGKPPVQRHLLFQAGRS
jgi:hypothetical protein